MKRGRGRPIRLNAALQRRVCALLRKGSTIKSAMILCGVAERSFHSWMKRGKRNEQPYKSFFDAASHAREQHKANLIAVVREAAHKDARHAEWLLERQFPHEFAPYDRRPIPVEPEPEKKITVAFVVDTKGKTLQEVAAFPTEQAEPEPPLPEPEQAEPESFHEWDGDVSRLGRVVRDASSGSLIDLPLDGNGG
jgi:hypothetical protein